MRARDNHYGGVVCTITSNSSLCMKISQLLPVLRLLLHERGRRRRVWMMLQMLALMRRLVRVMHAR